MDTYPSYFDEKSIANWTTSKHGSTMTFYESCPKSLRLISFNRYESKPQCDIVFDTSGQTCDYTKFEGEIYDYANDRSSTVVGFCDEDVYAAIDIVEQLVESKKLSDFVITTCHLDM